MLFLIAEVLGLTNAICQLRRLVRNWNFGKPMSSSLMEDQFGSTLVPQELVYSDASSTGYGGYVVELGNEVAHGHWSVMEVKHSSTWRELKAVYLVLQSFASRLAGHSVKWFTDNQGVVHIVSCGSKKPHLQDGAMAIFELLFPAWYEVRNGLDPSQFKHTGRFSE